MPDKRDIDEQTGVETTGHSWDGIRELNNPLPRWWLWTFYATVVFAIGYTIAYPAWPGLRDATRGVAGWSSRGDIHRELAGVDAARASQRDRIRAMPVEDVLANAELRQFAASAGASLFKVNCVQCHGSGAQGGRGYPNLNDDSWVWGGTPAQILQTIAHGIRDPSDGATRLSEMPKFGADGLLTAPQIGQVTEHVLKVAGHLYDASGAAEGAKLYIDNCAACHGDAGQGSVELGAPQLNDAIWLYGGTKDDILAQIRSPRHGMMPAWQPRLGETAVKELAVYVHSLGGAQ
jgi:cytochrome c oxidase cbb3-type subunit 3